MPLCLWLYPINSNPISYGAKQAFNIKVEDTIETRLEESEASSGHSLV